MRVLFLCLVFAFSLCVMPVHAGSDYSFAVSDIEGAIGEVHEATVSITIDGAAIDGYQLAICHDQDMVELSPQTIDDEGVISLELGDPGFEGLTVTEDGYWFVGVVIDLMNDVTLATGGDAFECYYELLDIGDSTLEICDTGLDAGGISVAVAGVSTEVTDLTDGAVSASSPFTFLLREGSSAMDASGGTGTATINFAIENDATSGTNAFSVSVTHDDTYLTPTDALPLAPLNDLNDGDGADFYSASLDPDGETGTTVGVVFNFIDFDITMDYADGANLIEFTYDVSDGPDCSVPDDAIDTDVTFESVDGVINEVIISTTSIAPTLDDSEGTISLSCSDDPEFLRGDCDGNNVTFPILDALYVLEYGFVNGPIPPCLAAADCDGNGVVFPILDALYLLEYGFINGPEPPAPGPTDCGVDTNVPGPGCETPPAC